MDINIPAPILAPDIGPMDLHDKIIYIVDMSYKAGFTLLANVLIYQLSNFHIL